MTYYRYGRFSDNGSEKTGYCPINATKVYEYDATNDVGFTAKFLVFKHALRGGYWSVLEYQTGLSIPCIGDTKKEVIRKAIATISVKKDDFLHAINNAIKSHGLAPHAIGVQS